MVSAHGGSIQDGWVGRSLVSEAGQVKSAAGLRPVRSGRLRQRAVRWSIGLLLVLALIAFGYAPVLRGMGVVLVVEDPLEPAAAIVVLGGQAGGAKVHARRVRLTWRRVAGSQSRGIVRTARQDPFDPGRWWKEKRFALAVVREYLGLLNYWAGFPIAARAPTGT